jgi:hypothetical protein
MLLYLKSLINRTKRHRNASPDTVGRVAPTRGIRDRVTATRLLLLGNDPLHRKLLVPQKLGIHALAGGVPLLLGLLDPVPVRLPRLVVRGMVLSKGERSKVRFVATGARKKACRAPATPQRRGGSARAGAGLPRQGLVEATIRTGPAGPDDRPHVPRSAYPFNARYYRHLGRRTRQNDGGQRGWAVAKFDGVEQNSARARHKDPRASHDDGSPIHILCIVVLDASSASTAASDAGHAESLTRNPGGGPARPGSADRATPARYTRHCGYTYLGLGHRELFFVF